MRAEDLYQAIAETNPEYLEQSESGIKRRTNKVILRSALIAAVIAAAGCVTALAVTFSLRSAARMDMGVSKEALIPEWTEYEGVQITDEETKMPAQVSLAATMCSGRQLYAYLEVFPIDAEIAQVCGMPDVGDSWYWDIGGISPQGYNHFTFAFLKFQPCCKRLRLLHHLNQKYLKIACPDGKEDNLL